MGIDRTAGSRRWNFLGFHQDFTLHAAMITQSGPVRVRKTSHAFVKETIVTPRMGSTETDEGQKPLPNPNTTVQAFGFCRPPGTFVGSSARNAGFKEKTKDIQSYLFSPFSEKKGFLATQVRMILTQWILLSRSLVPSSRTFSFLSKFIILGEGLVG